MTPAAAPTRLWCGYIDGKPDAAGYSTFDLNASGYGLFTNRKLARKHYQDVRRVEIREVSKPKKARKP